MWWYGHRYFSHMIGDAITPTGEKMVNLPIARPTDAIRAEVEPAAQRLITLTNTRRDAVKELLTWLRVEFGVNAPGGILSEFRNVAETAFIEEVRTRRGRGAVQLRAAALNSLVTERAEYTGRVNAIDAEMNMLERRLSDAVNRAYGLTAEEIALMWRTAPPRMPVKPQ